MPHFSAMMFRLLRPIRVRASDLAEPGFAISRIGTVRYYLLLLSLFPVLLWPAAINGGPILFADTTAYIRGPDAIVARLTGHRTVWTRNVPAIATSAQASGTVPGSAATPARSSATDKPILLGRSIYYGVLAYLGVLTTGWVTLLAQALVAWACALGLLRHLVDPADPRRFLAAALLGLGALALSPLSFFASFVMPDIFTGCAMLAAAALLAGWDRETARGRIGWGVLTTFAALAHASNVLILLALAAGGVAVVLLARLKGASASSGLAAGAAVLVVSALAGLAGDAAFAAGITRATGRAPIRPPFVTARLVADGLAGPYLAKVCSERDDRPRFVLCRYSSQMPPVPSRPWSDGFLWNKDARSGGVFTAAPAATQRALADEQGRFVMAVFLDRPVAVTINALAASLEQAGMTGLNEFNYNRSERAAMPARLPESVLTEVRTTAAYRGTMPVAAAQVVGWLVGFAALCVIAAAIRVGRPPRIARYAAVIGAGWLANAMLCGALSTPHNRYNTRALWPLFVLGAGAGVAAASRRRAAGTA